LLGAWRSTPQLLSQRRLKAVKAQGGLVIAQDPDDAEYDGMPRSAIMTGAVDLVLPVAKIPVARQSLTA